MGTLVTCIRWWHLAATPLSADSKNKHQLERCRTLKESSKYHKIVGLGDAVDEAIVLGQKRYELR